MIEVPFRAPWFPIEGETNRIIEWISLGTGEYQLTVKSRYSRRPKPLAVVRADSQLDGYIATLDDDGLLIDGKVFQDWRDISRHLYETKYGTPA